MNYEEIKKNTIKEFEIKITKYVNENNRIEYLLEKDDGWVMSGSVEEGISDLKMLGCEF